MQEISLNVAGPERITLGVEQIEVVKAVSPTIDVERVEGGVQVTVEDYRHEPETAMVRDGKDGKDGENGKDGEDGKDGVDGQDGVTPVRGVDYWTAQDVQDLTDAAIAATLAAYPAAEGVSF